MQGRKPRDFSLAVHDVPILQQIARSRTLPWFQVQLERLDPLSAYAKQLGIVIEEGFGVGKIQLEIFEKTVEEKLRAPCFITAYPTEGSPFARRNELDPSITDRFEFFIAGQEIANGFSELNDPEDQAERFRCQAEEIASFLTRTRRKMGAFASLMKAAKTTYTPPTGLRWWRFPERCKTPSSMPRKEGVAHSLFSSADIGVQSLEFTHQRALGIFVFGVKGADLGVEQIAEEE